MVDILEDGSRVLRSTVTLDKFTDEISKCFDYDFDGCNSFKCLEIPKESLPANFNIGLIVGASGSGKSTLLRDFGTEEDITWDNTKCIASNFNSPTDAINRLGAVGLNSVPTWTKPYYVLSNGEKFRADLARRIKDGAVIDEFTSVVDRNVAKSCAVSISKYIKKNDVTNIVFASCHRDIIEWLEPDWVFDTDTEELTVRGLVRRPPININIYETNYNTWRLFKNHHYLSNTLNKSCKCYVALWDDIPVGFQAVIAMPGKIPPLYKGDKRNKFRESRCVVLPDYQGMGIGTRLSNAIGELYLDMGYRYFSKTAHVRMGEYRNNSYLWRPTAMNMKDRQREYELTKDNDNWHNYLVSPRFCYCHEYIGSYSNKYRIAYEQGYLD